MPQIKNWAKDNDELYQYRQDSRIAARIWNDNEQFTDQRHSNWVGELLFGGVPIKQLFSGEKSKPDARETFVAWLKDNPTLDVEDLKEQYQAEMRGLEDESVGEMPANPCVNFDTCGNSTPTEKNHICPSCLSDVRYEDSDYNRRPAHQ